MVRSIDPRDVTTEIDDPEFRVHFVERLSAPTDGSGTAYRTDEHELVGGDVREVLAWIDAERRGRDFILWASIIGGASRERTNVRLAGSGHWPALSG